ncbi:hypothetical protein VIBNIAM115_430020 [Vibrio nigripulchritudo AM115]|nr:hypothetical protein VIBNIAM115_430020 [Vibrio nigripulchritudo AM115]
MVFGVQLVVHTHQVLVGHGTQLGASCNHISGLILIQANEKAGYVYPAFLYLFC